jgi:hypothetical protein
MLSPVPFLKLNQSQMKETNWPESYKVPIDKHGDRKREHYVSKREYVERKPIGIDVKKRGATYQWTVRSRNKLTVYKQGRELTHTKARQKAIEAREQVLKEIGPVNNATWNLYRQNPSAFRAPDRELAGRRNDT